MKVRPPLVCHLQRHVYRPPDVMTSKTSLFQVFTEAVASVFETKDISGFIFFFLSCKQKQSTWQRIILPLHRPNGFPSILCSSISSHSFPPWRNPVSILIDLDWLTSSSLCFFIFSSTAFLFPKIASTIYWQFNYDAPGQTGFFLQSHFEYFCLTSFSPQYLGHTCMRPTVEYLKFQNLFWRFYDVRSAMEGS